MKNKNIALIGFMGSGKTLVAKKLGELFDWEVISIDALIIEKEGKAIGDIFAESGQSYFRQLEKDFLKQAVERQSVIIDGGGGIILDEANRTLLKEKCVVIHLSASADVIYERIKDETHRPLVNVDDPKTKIEELLEKRQSFYAQADYVIKTDHKNPEAVCQEIKEMIQND